MSVKICSKTVHSTDASNFSYENTSIAAIRMYKISDGDIEKIDTTESSVRCEVGMDIKQWIQQTESLSSNNFNNKYFESIVAKGEEAVPYIYEKLKEGPTHLVHALELIYPEEIKYKGFISLKQARKIWLKILQKRIYI